MSGQCSDRFKPLEESSCGLYISGIQGESLNNGLSREKGRKVPVLQCSCRVTTRQSQHLGESGPSRIEGVTCTQVVSIVKMSEMGQSRSERVIEIRGSLCYRVVIESCLGDCYIW